LDVDQSGWADEMRAIDIFLDEYGARTPTALRAELKKNSAHLMVPKAA
jgi:hypothetical protein